MKRMTSLKLHKPRTIAETIFDNLDVSETTKKDYLARVGFFLSFVDSHGFNRQTYLSFKKYLATRNDYAISTKNKYLITAKVFLRELVRQGKLPLDMTHNIKQFKQTKRHRKEGLSDEQIKLIGVKFKYLPNTYRNTRLKALFSLLAFQGLRQIEIVRLNVNDIDLKKKTAFVRGKGEDDKEQIYLAPATITALREYIIINNLESGALFKSMGNRKSERMSTMTIKRELGAILNDLGIQKSVHGFRHFYITELLKSMSMRDVQKFSRHKSMEMLLVYDDEISIKDKAKQVFTALEKFSLH